jgi:hypothetical protein
VQDTNGRVDIIRHRRHRETAEHAALSFMAERSRGLLPQPAITQTCRALRSECLPAFKKSNVFFGCSDGFHYRIVAACHQRMRQSAADDCLNFYYVAGSRADPPGLSVWMPDRLSAQDIGWDEGHVVDIERTELGKLMKEINATRYRFIG